MEFKAEIESKAEKEYAEFEAKVKRTVWLDNLSPQATEGVIAAALEQFGNVVNVRLIPNYIGPSNAGGCALVEMKTSDQVSTVIEELTSYPFMVCGMPRPVRAFAAQPEMFDDRPSRPGRKITLCWLDPCGSDFVRANKLKKLAQQHSAEVEHLVKCQVKEEQRLSTHQNKALKAAEEKMHKVEDVVSSCITKRLAKQYGVKLA